MSLLLIAFVGGVMIGATMRSDIGLQSATTTTLRTAEAPSVEPAATSKIPKDISDRNEDQQVAALQAPDGPMPNGLFDSRRAASPDPARPVPLDFWQLRQPSLPRLRVEKIQVERGDTLMKILTEAGIGRAEANEVVTSLGDVYDPRNLRPGQYLNLEIERTTAGEPAKQLAGLSLNLDFENDLRLERRASGGFAARIIELPLNRQIRTANATIDDSLYAAARGQSVPDRIVLDLIKLFSWDVDFQRDIRRGDSFDLTYDMVHSPDLDEAYPGDLLFAALKVGDRQMDAYRYVGSDGTARYYDKQGRALRKWLMRTPIDGARLSSGFGMRKHPVLGYSRMHKGVDFAAPRGTPVYAAGDGTIGVIGRTGSYGNYIRIDHNNDYDTAYAHLSGFAKGLKKGGSVQQGQIIGYVGSTGRSTGSHLHYEVMKGDEQINPLSVKITEVVQLADGELERFERQVASISQLTANSQSASAADTVTR